MKQKADKHKREVEFIVGQKVCEAQTLQEVNPGQKNDCVVASKVLWAV